MPRPLFALPPGLTWPATPGVTLLGDAAHLMPPVGQGQGANLAMLDTAGLALALAASPGDQEGALRRYETAMFARASEAARGVGVHRGPPHVPHRCPGHAQVLPARRPCRRSRRRHSLVVEHVLR
ncbi:FAD-dependent oxidoreductase [Streptomyces sp. NBC_01187]|uniref:FAD-dependent oxidoreductase n=1 Tax=Streptomyces sp. NBC_01187 TaxID=2903766 RepID=UPI003868352D|nr:FAD-dependent monooxygenase [Streptomyces sp. NBC_01187]